MLQKYVGNQRLNLRDSPQERADRVSDNDFLGEARKQHPRWQSCSRDPHVQTCDAEVQTDARAPPSEKCKRCKMLFAETVKARHLAKKLEASLADAIGERERLVQKLDAFAATICATQDP